MKTNLWSKLQITELEEKLKRARERARIMRGEVYDINDDDDDDEDDDGDDGDDEDNGNERNTRITFDSEERRKKREERDIKFVRERLDNYLHSIPIVGKFNILAINLKITY